MGERWKPEHDARYSDQFVLNAITKVFWCKKKGKVYLVLSFKQPEYIAYVWETMALCFNDDPAKRYDFSSLLCAKKEYPSKSGFEKKYLLFVELRENFPPHTIVIFNIPESEGEQYVQRVFKGIKCYNLNLDRDPSESKIAKT